MENKKKIGDIYREKLRDVETTPPADAWENISAALDEKQQKSTFLPIWLRLAGCAALLAIIIIGFLWPASTLKPSSEPAFAVPVERNWNTIDPVSPYYKETMLRSSILLEMLMNQSRKSNAAEEIASKEEYQASNNAEKVLAETQESEVVIPGSKEEPSASEVAEKEPILPEETELFEAVKGGNEIEQAFAEKNTSEEKTVKNVISKRFSVTPTAGAVYFDHPGTGNALTAQFAGQESKGQVSMAYGVSLAYQVSEKVKIRTGVSKVELGQNTTQTSFASAMNSTLTVVDPEDTSSPATGNLQQKMGFIEIPMEMEYNLFKKRFGLNLIGGASALILDKNDVSLDSPYATMRTSEANNLNSLSFSANLGFGLDYDISNDFQLNLEPILKYQLNTFKDAPGVKPYFFGIYSGLSYKF
ncbi:outer membrane beta-barrel protein [Salinimicrobium sp. GXAS 041]|uniref:outer membrane beta-barrel protein n=1 Tax=Salinimicrobium sp. GXAS 041 TaxID=3400806 RepID=UPI003C774DCC